MKTRHHFPQDEREAWAARGWRIIEPAQQPCLLPISEWHEDSFLATKGDEVLISVIFARVPRNGAWTRLLRNLKLARFRKITVVCPLSAMERVLAKTGFSGPFRHGRTFWDSYQYWTKEL